MFRDPDLNAVESTLAVHVVELCRDIFPNGRREGNEWRVGSIHGEKGRSFGVHLAGPRVGWWGEFNGGQAGRGLLSLIAAVPQCGCNGNFREAIRWGRRWLGQDQSRDTAFKREAERRPTQASIKPRPDFQAIGNELYFKARRELIGSPVEAYLSERAIGLTDLPRRPHFLRYAPQLWHSQSRRAWPGMIAAFVDQTGKFLAAHRTFLAVAPDGIVGKAPVGSQKMVLGSPQGGVIPVWPGIEGEAWPKIKPGEKLAICEGIENALSVAVMLPHWRVVAAGSVGNLQYATLPPGIAELVIGADNDPCFDARGEVNKVLAALDEAIRNFRRQGVPQVRVTHPHLGKDFNDLLKILSGR
jgi:hypothetical protein